MNPTAAEAIRRHLRKRDGDVCWLCGEAFPAKRRRHRVVTLDHVLPKSAGGNNDPKNLRLAHRLCNQLRGVAAADTAQAIVRLKLAEMRLMVAVRFDLHVARCGAEPSPGERASIEAKVERDFLVAAARETSAAKARAA